MPDEARQLQRIATIADDLDKIIDKLFASVAELRVLLTAQNEAAGKPHPPEGRDD